MSRFFLFVVLYLAILNSSCKDQDSVPNATGNVVEAKVFHEINRVEPPHWWVGFKNKELQLLVQHEAIAAAEVSIDKAGVLIKSIKQGDSDNYLFIDLILSEGLQAGLFDIKFKFQNGDQNTHSYELKDRLKTSEEYRGFDSSDVIYLITPDRFANGNTENDVVTGLKENKIDRTLDYARHGGDIQGVINHLDYISEMGFTQIWPSPVLTNDMPQWSYHGYAMTDFYEVDPRFGSLIDYKALAAKAREKGVGLIMDQVANHCGIEHWWMKDLPFKDWVNYQADFEEKKNITYSNHRRTSNQDIYASQSDRKGMTEGWFVPSMPDLNQRNPYLGKYIIQNSIWWIETLQLSGIRQDTYPYPDKAFMSDWAGAIMEEYPNFSIVGEEWSTNPLLVGYWQTGANNKDAYESHLTSTMDFPMQENMIKALNETEGWDTGLVKLYDGLANDFHYASPKDILIFPDNHDMDRLYTQLKKDIVKTKMALSYLLVLPRIPQVYYGTEVLMQNTEKLGDHGLIRTDFPGGFIDDQANAFTGMGLTEEQLEMQAYIKKLLNYRKKSAAIHRGKTVHFAPINGVYVLFRLLEEEIVVIILSKNEKETLDLSRFSELGLQGKSFKNIITNTEFIWRDTLELSPKGAFIFTSKLK